MLQVMTEPRSVIDPASLSVSDPVNASTLTVHAPEAVGDVVAGAPSLSPTTLEAVVEPVPVDLTQREIVELYSQHHAALVRFAELVAPEDGMAEDLVQEAFVKLFTKRRRVQDISKAPAYLRSTVINLARGRGRRMSVALRHRPAPAPDASSAEEGAMASEQHREVIEALRHLPARQRECLVLRHYEGMTESEIAGALGISVGSVRTHTSRGTAAMERLLENGS
jgi:RNA polymerase sigma-70 factor (sigma-E family)